MVVGAKAISSPQLAPGANSPTHPLDVTINPSLSVGALNVTGVSPFRLVTVTLNGLLGAPLSAKGWLGNEMKFGLASIELATGVVVEVGVGVGVAVALGVAVGVVVAVTVAVAVGVVVAVAVAV